MNVENLKLVADDRRVSILRRAVAGEEFSAKTIADQRQESIPAISYHVRALADAGLLRHSRSVQRRGAQQRYYRLNGRRRRDVERLLAAADVIERG